MTRMRNIKQAYLYIKEQDSETALTESAFRKIVKKGIIPTLCISSRVNLINLDDVDAFLQNEKNVVVEGAINNNNKDSKIRKQEINVHNNDKKVIRLCQ